MTTKKTAIKPSKKKVVTKEVMKKKSIATSSKAPAMFLAITEREQMLLQQHKELRLQIELVPASCFWSNVRTNIKGSEWDKIRFRVYERADFLCEICGERGTKHPVECHEVWTYDDTTHTQSLSHFQSLCPLCHEVKHMGFASIRGNRKRALSRFIEINQLDVEIAKEIKSVVFKQHSIRSKQEWVLDIEHLKEWGISARQ